MQRPILLLAVVTALLLVPFFAMQFTDEVCWTAFDFLVATGLLMTVALGVEGVLRYIPRRAYRIAGLAIWALLFLLIWMELAVGLLGTPLAGR